MSTVICANVEVSGRVQGVGFRFATVRRAGECGITGWVRNTPSGTVEVLVQGEGDDVTAMIDWLRQGPLAAWVDGTRVRPCQVQEELVGFRVEY